MKKFLVFMLALTYLKAAGNEQTLIAANPDAQGNPEDEDNLFELFDLGDDDLVNDHGAEMQQIEVGRVRVQPEFFKEHGIDAKAVIDSAFFDGDSFVEYDNAQVYSTSLKKNLQVKSIKADGYCFIKFKDETGLEKPFFYKCEDKLIEEEVFLRVLNEKCPYPENIPPQAPSTRECTYYAKKSSDIVQNAVKVVGENLAQMVAECMLTYIQTEKTEVVVKCSEEALSEEWKKITGSELNTYKAELEEVVDENGQTKYVGSEDVTKKGTTLRK